MTILMADLSIIIVLLFTLGDFRLSKVSAHLQKILEHHKNIFMQFTCFQFIDSATQNDKLDVIQCDMIYL